MIECDSDIEVRVKKKKRLKYLWVKWHPGICFKIFQFKEKVGVDEAKMAKC